jgi:hypothetical protein
MTDAIDAYRAATRVSRHDTAGFALMLRPDQRPSTVAQAIEAAFSPVAAKVEPLSALDQRVLVVHLSGRIFGTDDAATYALADEFDIEEASRTCPPSSSHSGHRPAARRTQRWTCRTTFRRLLGPQPAGVGQPLGARRHACAAGLGLLAELAMARPGPGHRGRPNGHWHHGPRRTGEHDHPPHAPTVRPCSRCSCG